MAPPVPVSYAGDAYARLHTLLVDRKILIDGDAASAPERPPRALLLRAVPPKVSTLVASPLLCPCPDNGGRLIAPVVAKRHRLPMVVGCSGGLALLATTDGGYHVCNPFTGDTFRLPAPDPPIHSVDGLGIATRDGEYAVAHLHSCCVRCFSSVTGEWEEAPAVCPDFSASDMVVASGSGELYWVDLSHGILSFDPFASAPTVRFISLPQAASRVTSCFDEWTDIRCVGDSAGRLRFFDVDAEAGSLSLWVLGYDSCKWMLEHKVDFADLWVDERCGDCKLPEDEVPCVGFVDPMDEHIVYVVHHKRLFAVNLRTKQLLNCCSEINAGLLPPIPWVLPPLPHMVSVSPYPSRA